LPEVQAQVIMRQRVRDDESKKGSSDRRRASDAVVEAERSIADALAKVDRAGEAARSLGRPPIEDSAVTAARAALSNAQDELRKRRDALATVEQTSGLPTFPESELEIARANLNLARIALERTRLRAPIDGQVLQLKARIGEVAPPSQQDPLVVMGDLSSLRIRAELDERASGKVKIGHSVSVRATAFSDQTFTGKVARIAPFVGPSRMNTQPSRAINVDVVEVSIDLINPGPLIVGMQVDVYFYPDGVDRSSAR
jgi:HlyD family secretion protein